MFTGIVEHKGEVLEIPGPKGGKLSVRTPFAKLSLGGSVAVEGVCLTVVAKKKAGKGTLFTAELAEETLRKTTLGTLKKGSRVNLEQPLSAGGRVGGHFVQGHVDGVGKVLSVKPEGHSKLYAFGYPALLGPYLVPKGSVAVDGISLTLVDVAPGHFTAAVLPFTEEQTSLGGKKPGDPVNLEADFLAKVTAKQVQVFLQQGGPGSGELYQKREIPWSDLMGPEETF